MKIANNVTELIGNTPLVRLSKFSSDSAGEIIAKLESFNPGSSAKDRIGINMILKAEEEGKLSIGTTIIEPTSGNTGIALAYIAAQRGYKIILTMPESMSIERRKLLALLGANILLTPKEEGMSGAVRKAKELADEIPDSWIPQQFENDANPKSHEQTTAQEIWLDTDGDIDIFVASVGTGGTLTGVAKGLKKKKAGVQIIAVEPKNSAVLSGKSAGSHRIQGIGAGFIPSVLDVNLIDEIIQVDDNDAFSTTKKLIQEEGILAGISSGATLWAATQIANRKENKGKKIVVLLPDTGERYLSLLLTKEELYKLQIEE